MRVLVYAGHSGGAGGGENHTAGFLNILQEYYDVTAMVDPEKLGWKDEVKVLFGYDLDKVKFRILNPAEISNYDIFININHGMLYPPLARRNIILCFFPQHEWNTEGYDTIMANSEFSKKHIVERWHRLAQDVNVIYPPVDLDKFYNKRKKKQIMTIGRYFEVPDGNNKNHIFMIEAFKKIKDPQLRFCIVGSVQNKDYYNRVREAAASDPRIEFYSDLTQKDILAMYSDSMFYWHAAGYETDLPSSMEHFGMASIEAMASGCIPIVHNSGGMPESGALIWETEQELIDQTNYYLHKPIERKQFADGMKAFVQTKFSLECTTKKLIQTIEKPIAIYRPGKNSFFQKPLSSIEVDPKEIKIGIIGDAPNLTTGFGLVEKMFGRGFKKAGFQVTQIGVQDSNYEPRMDDEWRVWRPGGRALDHELLSTWLARDKPNIIWINYDAGNIASWLNMLSQLKCDIPVIAYYPIEGFPIPESFIHMSKLIAKPVTYLKWGSDLMFEQSGFRIDHVPHGLDHAKFERFDEERRQLLKYDIGWGKKFVIGFFGRNKRTKQQPRMIETMRMLVNEGITDIVCYMHCQQFEGHMMNGWALDQIVQYNDMTGYITFPPDNAFSQAYGVDYEQPREIPEEIISKIYDNPDDSQAVKDAKARATILASYSMIERYNMCDLFITLSQAEGFNLPLGEAMACGVPILSVNDSGSQFEVANGAARFIDPIEWDTWHIGTLLPITSKKTIVNEICKIMADPELRKEMSDASLKKAKTYTWDGCCDQMNRIVKELYIKTHE
jgi:glycosyltransferase involved in cell wall biosynthesis